jgi:Asp-tRNA(Asn)/Glu-tRNA(Gln) amidotransferase A subunit family amidase
MTSPNIPPIRSDASASELAELLQSAAFSPLEIARFCLDRIAQKEPSLGAWAYHDADLVLQQARAAEKLPAESPLLGVLIGIKDIFDTADMPTAYGSALYAGHRPTRDAEVVARLRSAGALIAGKTVTTEFAYAYPGKTVNPHNALHTPGGSSSGSAAAVAAGMVPIALGSQTGGSTIRPSAYCGIVGFKPTHGLVPTAGMRPLAPSMDTVGIHARTMSDVSLVFPVLCGVGAVKPFVPKAIRIAYFPGPHSDEADDDSRRSLEAARDALRAAGYSVEPIILPADDFGLLNEAQRLIMAYEAASTLRKEHEHHRNALSEAMVSLLDGGEKISVGDYQKALTLAARWRHTFASLLGDERVLMTFSAPGEAPLLSTGTGSSVFNRAWTLMGLPCLTMPFGRGTKAGLPLGIQFVGSPHRDGMLLACAARIEKVFEPFNSR